jgi:hypothetical protein
VTSRPDGLATTLRRLGAVKVVGLATIVVVTVVLVWAVLDVRGLAADRPPSVAPVAAAGEGTRGDDTQTQVAVKVTFSGTGPFSATVVDASKKERTFTSAGEDVVFTRVYEGAGPYLLASLQTSADATVRCRIDVDGEKVSATAKSGLYAQTVCAG